MWHIMYSVRDAVCVELLPHKISSDVFEWGISYAEQW